jgi:hypothetical protein
MDDKIMTLILAVFASSGFWAFLTEMISRPRQRQTMAALEATNTRIDALEKAQASDRAERQRERARDLEAQAEAAADQAREEILRVSDEIYNGVMHSREFFDQVLDKIDTYERFCGDHKGYQNSKAVTAIARIRQVYTHLDETHGFL